MRGATATWSTPPPCGRPAALRGLRPVRDCLSAPPVALEARACASSTRTCAWNAAPAPATALRRDHRHPGGRLRRGHPRRLAAPAASAEGAHPLLLTPSRFSWRPARPFPPPAAGQPLPRLCHPPAARQILKNGLSSSCSPLSRWCRSARRRTAAWASAGADPAVRAGPTARPRGPSAGHRSRCHRPAEGDHHLDPRRPPGDRRCHPQVQVAELRPVRHQGVPGRRQPHVPAQGFRPVRPGGTGGAPTGQWRTRCG